MLVPGFGVDAQFAVDTIPRSTGGRTARAGRRAFARDGHVVFTPGETDDLFVTRYAHDYAAEQGRTRNRILSGIGRGIAEHFGPSARASSSTAAPSAKRMRSAIASAPPAGPPSTALPTSQISRPAVASSASPIETFGGSTCSSTTPRASRGATSRMRRSSYGTRSGRQSSRAVPLSPGGGEVDEDARRWMIVNIGSVNAYIGEPKLGPYRVEGWHDDLTRNAAASLNRHRIRVNQLNVGWTLTEGEERVKRTEGKGPEWLEEADRHPSIRPPALAPRHRPRRGLFASDDSASTPARSRISSSIPSARRPTGRSKVCRPASASFRSAFSTSSSMGGCRSSSGFATRRRSAAKAWSTTTGSFAVWRRNTAADRPCDARNGQVSSMICFSPDFTLRSG